MVDVLIAIALVLSRLYLMYWMCQGIREVSKIKPKIWSIVYILAISIYIYFASASTLNHDVADPLRLLGSLAGGTIVTILVISLRAKIKYGG